MSQLYSNSIFFVDIEKVKPNPFQPRREFDEDRLRDLADSIRQYGVLQPLVVSREEIQREDGSISVEYELIAGERRLRASKLAGIEQIPVIIRVGDDNMTKLELAIIENLQREDLNAVERARAFMRLVEEFKFTLVFTVVGLFISTNNPSGLIPASRVKSINSLPELSFPTNPQRITSAPSDLILFATFAAPPKWKVSSSISTTGTGASGDTLETVPQKYLSSITSPITAIFLLFADSINSFVLSNEIFCISLTFYYTLLSKNNK